MKKMKRIILKWYCLAMLVVIVFMACAGTKLTDIQVDESRRGKPVSNILVIGVTYKENEQVRRSFEDRFVAQLKAAGVMAISSGDAISIPSDLMLKKEQILKAANEFNNDAVIITHVAPKEVKESYTRSYEGYYIYYGEVYSSAHRHDYSSTRTYHRLATKQKAKDASYLRACHECDLLHRLGTLSEGQVAVWVRCGAVLHQKKPYSFDRSLALTIGGLILFAMANSYPLLAIKSGSLQQATTLLGSVHVLLGAGVWHIALLVFLTAILFPFLELVLMFIVLVSLKMKKQVRNLPLMLVFVQAIRPWGMMEVFMLGILVSVVKLVKMVKVIPGISLYALAVLIFVIAAITTTFDTNEAWDTLKGDQ